MKMDFGQFVQNIAAFIKEVGAPTALAFAIWHLANKAMQLQAVVEALIRIDEKIERLLLLVGGDKDDA